MRPTANLALDSAIGEVRQGLSALDSMAPLDPQSLRNVRRTAPGVRPPRGGGIDGMRTPTESAERSSAVRRALNGLDAVIDAAVAGGVAEQDLLRARQAVERLERESGTMDDRRRARYTGMMLQALITRSPADCDALKVIDPMLRRFPPQQARTRAVVAAACRA
jgi:hypothetical protein